MNLFNKLILCFIIIGTIFSDVYAQSYDPRNILNGNTIYDNGYIDQPYVVILNDGSWLCVFTTGPKGESKSGQHIVSSISTNQGKTWSAPADIEPSNNTAASWAVPYLTSFGRIYVFYDYNGDHVNTLNGKPIWHNSELGWYCYKYSDDNGLTWSDRSRLPMPKAPVDLHNDFKGNVQLFWGIDKPKMVGTNMLFAFTRLGKYIQSDGEGWFYKSDNIYNERDPKKIHWELLPDGKEGLRNPKFGSVQEEFNTVPLRNSDVFCMYRTAMGFAACSYSRDGGHTWSLPIAATYTPDDHQVLKNPRACPRVFKCSNGKYLFWFHNNGGKGYEGRNPVWISGGVEKNGFIHWSQPEILLYSNDSTIKGMSYPDLIEQNGRYWFTETQKTKARVHPINSDLLKGVWNQANAKSIIKKGIIFKRVDIKKNKKYHLKKLPGLKEGGFSIDLWIEFQDLNPGQVILDSRDENGKGLLITTSDKQSLKLSMSDGSTMQEWHSDSTSINVGKMHHVVFIVDGAPHIITGVVDGKLCDGGSAGQFGWKRFSKKLEDVNGNKQLKLSSSLHGKIKELRIYNRYLTTAEAISNFHAGVKR